MIFIVYKKKGNWQISAVEKSTESFYVVNRNDIDFPTKNSRVNHSDVPLVIYLRENAIVFRDKMNDYMRERDNYITTAYGVYNNQVESLVTTYNNPDDTLKKRLESLNLSAISGQDGLRYFMSGDIALIVNLSPESLLNLYEYFRDCEEEFTTEIVRNVDDDWTLIVYRINSNFYK